MSAELLKMLKNAVVTVLAAFWQKLVGWLNRIVDKVKQLLPNKVVEGIRSFVAKVGGVLKNKAKTYAKDQVTGRWEETVVVSNVDENEVPDFIRMKLSAVNDAEVENTEELINQLRG